MRVVEGDRVVENVQVKFVMYCISREGEEGREEMGKKCRLEIHKRWKNDK